MPRRNNRAPVTPGLSKEIKSRAGTPVTKRGGAKERDLRIPEGGRRRERRWVPRTKEG